MNALFSTLRRVTAYAYESRSGMNSTMQWSGRGNGRVIIESAPDGLYFQERGRLTLDLTGATLPTQNEFFWQARPEDGVALLQTRSGRQHPVFLFTLVQKTSRVWESLTPHLCGKDTYWARATLETTLNLAWTIKGPHKDEQLTYVYR